MRALAAMQSAFGLDHAALSALHYFQPKQTQARLDTRINDRDLGHLNAFPNERKSAVMRKILSQEADQAIELDGPTDFEKVLLNVRREGYSLIHLQRNEASFWSVWYRKGLSLLGGRRERVIMLLWQADEPAPHTTVLTWAV